MMRRLVAVVSLSLGWSSASCAQDDGLPAARAATQRVVSELSLDGAGLMVLLDGAAVHLGLHGDFAADRALPIGAASRWLAVATVLTLVDDGVLDLDLPVARYVTEFDNADKRRITLRQCLCCTSGLPAELGGRMRGWDMQRFAAAAAGAGVRTQPGWEFEYGDVGFQVVAVAAERASGRSWHELFAARIARPLGMTATAFGGFAPLGAEPGKVALPWVAAGAVSTLADYGRFVRMLLQEGEVDGQRVLQRDSVAAMFADQVKPQVDVKPVGFAAEGVRYGLGTWLVPIVGGAVRATAPGESGFVPWLDRDLGVGGVFAAQDGRRVLANMPVVQSAVREAVRSPQIAGTADEVTLRHGGRDRRYRLHVPLHDAAAGLPLLVVLHGGGGSGEHVREVTRLDELGVRAGFAVAFPDGTGRLPRRLLTWNSGGVDAYAARHDVDDVGFLRAVVADVEQRVAIDRRRIFAVGHSNGGMMCHRLAREAADVFTGIAVVGGAMDFNAVDATLPLAVLLIHGTADRHVRIRGGETEAGIAQEGRRVDASLQDAIDYYVARNGLSGYPETVVDGRVRVDTYAKPRGGDVAAPVRVVTLDGGGHAWPGSSERQALLADAPFPWSASRAIVAFFAALQPVAPRKDMTPSVPR